MEKNAGLSAPEAYLLISLPLCDPSKALKLGFMGLVAQGVLVLETAALWWRSSVPNDVPLDSVP